ncbi:MAG: peroxiredoxin family protein [Parashewanella sp.]
MMMRFISLLLFIMLQASDAFAENNALGIGDIAPNFTISRLDGSQFNLADFKGTKPVYLIFWNTWCGYCIKKVPKINELQRKLSNQIEILAINTSWDDDLTAIGVFQKQHQTDYPMAFDANADITKRYDVWGAPTEFIIDINGVVRHRDNIPEILSMHLKKWQCKKETC